ncbi:hypothetical protein EQV96_13665 [Pseudomonas sp. TMW22080]|nr:hypothetical protein [Pseudomonas sp. TMW22080]
MGAGLLALASTLSACQAATPVSRASPLPQKAVFIQLADSGVARTSAAPDDSGCSRQTLLPGP